jgi:oligopeptide transport system substrate-binding protein
MEYPQFLYEIKGVQDYSDGNLSNLDEIGLQVTDEQELVVELDKSSMSFPILMTSHTAALPIPKHVYELYHEEWANPERIVTNGPFLLESWHRGKTLTLTQNPTYKKSRIGNVQKAILYLDQPASSRAFLYEKNQMDAMTWGDFTYSARDQFHQQFPQDYIVVSGPGVGFISLNTCHPPLDDVRVRQAIAMTIDRERMVYETNRGYDIPANGGFIPENVTGHSQRINYQFQPQRGQRLLADAGFPRGKGFRLLHVLLWDDPITRTSFDFLASIWKETLGIEVHCDFLEWDHYLSHFHDEKYDIILQLRDFYPDPEIILGFTGTFYQSYWQNEDYIKILEQVRNSDDSQDRLILLQKADRVLIEDAAIIPIIYPTSHFWIKPWVKNYPGPLENVIIEDRPEN